MCQLSAKSIFIITTSIFGSAFLGIFLSTIIFDGPSPDSEEFFENESIEKSTITKTPIESTVEEEPEPTPIESTVEEEPEPTPVESTVEEEPEPTPVESTVEEEPEPEPTPTELEGTVKTSSLTGVQ